MAMFRALASRAVESGETYHLSVSKGNVLSSMVEEKLSVHICGQTEVTEFGNSPCNTCPLSDEIHCPIQARGMKKRESTSKGRRRVKGAMEKSIMKKKRIERANSSQGHVVYTPQTQSQPPFALGTNSTQGHSVYISQPQPHFVMGGTNVFPLMYPTYDGNNTPQSMPFVYPSHTSFQELL